MTKKIVVIGAGYVGSSLGILFAQNNEVVIVDVDDKKVDLINSKQSPILDSNVNDFLNKKDLNITATNDLTQAIKDCYLIIIALPTNYDEQTNKFDTHIIDNVVYQINNAFSQAPILIKSTIPIGYTDKLNEKYPNIEIIFSPEFLREGIGIHDCLYPSRIVIGSELEIGNKIAELLKSIALNNPEIFYMSSIEAEAVKLFANSYLANRVSFFNELDSFCLTKNLRSKNIIDAICSDNRIGFSYNNPSFGYGGYCLPKDTKQLLSNFGDIPQDLFSAVIKSNIKRKNFIADEIIKLKPKKIGVYRLLMKSESENFRESAIVDIIKILESRGIDLLIYEPLIKDITAFRSKFTDDLDHLKNECDLILANRICDDILDIEEKVFTRDIYREN